MVVTKPRVVYNFPGSYNGVRQGSTFSDFVTSGQIEKQITTEVNGDRKTPNPFNLYFAKRQNPNISQSIFNVREDGTTFDFERGSGSFESVTSGGYQTVMANELSQAEIDNEALSRVIEAIRGNEFNLPVALGTVKETAQTGRDLLKTTKQFVRSVAQRKLNIAAKSGALASAWLQYNLGIKPLIGDIQSALALQPRDAYVLKVKKGRTLTSTNTGDFRVNGSPLFRYSSKECIRGRMYDLEIRIDNPIVDLANRVNAWNLALLGWEVIPLSFVVDYFYDVGGYLDLLGASLSLPSNMEVRGSTTTLSKVTIRGISARDDVSGAFTTVVRTQGSGESVELVLSRSLVNGLPRPALPSMTVPSGSSQLLTCASLLRTLGLKSLDK